MVTTRSRARAARVGLLGLVPVLIVAGIVVFGGDRGHSAQDVRLLSGAAWLSSAKVGQLTLLDGASVEVAAQVQIAPAGNTLDVVQQDATAYAVDRTVGTVRRVDGATFDLTAPRSPISDARGGLTAFASRETLYALDAQRGILAAADPRTVTPRGEPLSLAAELTAGAAALDDTGRLWVVDNGTGDLTRVADGKRTTIPKVTTPGHSILTLADGRPVIVNLDDRKAIAIDPISGEIDSTTGLDLRSGDTVQISGSPHTARVYVVASRGVLTVCDLGASTCDNAVPLTNGNTLGAPVEAGNRVFVPDYTTGQVWIIDLSSHAVVAKSQVLTPPAPFQLLARDGVVFFNDPDTERAGVIKLDGRILNTAKYDPKDPAKGLTTPPTNSGTPPPPQTQPPNQPPPTQSPPNQPPPTQSPPNQPPPTPSPPNQPPPPNRPPTNQPPPTGQPPTTTPAPPPTTGQPPSTTPAPPAKPDLRITLSKTTPAVNENVGLQVGTTTGTTPSTAQWDFGDGRQGTGVTTSHQWTTAMTYQVSVQATMPDGQQATTSVSLQVTPPPTVTVPDVVGQLENTASKAISNANLRPQFTRVFSHTVPAGVVISQTPAGGETVAPQTTVTATVSSGPRAAIDLMTTAPSANWQSGAGQLTFRGQCDNAPQAPEGYAENCFNGPYLLEDGTAPNYIWSHPNWVDNGWITGTYTLPSPIIAGDHFRASVGFVRPIQPPSAGDLDFSVHVVTATGLVEVIRVHDTGADGVLRPIDVDLTRYAGATGIQLRADARGTTAQDWACWIAPKIDR